MGVPDSRGFERQSSRSVADVIKRREHAQELKIDVTAYFFSMVLNKIHPQRVN
jgi:hypothetical protein